MEIAKLIFENIALVCKILCMVYWGYKFITGDKEKRSTLWYGLALIAILI